jgi:hypothetical protein
MNGLIKIKKNNMKKLLLALILLISINSYAQEENVEYYDIQSVSYKIGMNKKEIIWSDWYKTEWNVRIDYYKEQQTITIIKEESDFYVIESYVDSIVYNNFTTYQFIATDRLNNKIIMEFMIPDNKDGFFIVITDKKDNIVMYKIK